MLTIYVQIKSTLQCSGIDLSSWKIAFNGSESVRPATLAKFTEKFSPFGFNSLIHFPCYGLAEATLFVTGIKAGRSPKTLSFSTDEDSTATQLISCGYPRNGDEICIVDPDTMRLQNSSKGHIGEIWVKGDSIAQGYWNAEEQSDGIFKAFLDNGQGPFMRTGDLGLIREGELYICGRLKNMIILRGKNYYPNDIEYALKQSHAQLARSQAAAFSVSIEDEEQLIIVQELDRAAIRANVFKELIAAIKRVLSEEFQIEAKEILLVEPGNIPLTTSGKIQHHLCREKYLSHSFSIVQSSEQSKVALKPSNQIDPLGCIATALNISLHDIDLSRSLSSHGLDSLKAVQIQSELKKNFGYVISLETIFGDTAINQLLRDLIQPIELTANY